MRGTAGVEQVALRRVADRPVDVLARAVDPGERLLVEETHEPVFLGGGLHHRHHQLLVISRDVRRFEVRGDLELSRCHLVVVGLGGDPEAVQLVLELLHEHLDASGDRAEVVVVELLTLRRRCTEQRASREQQVGAAVGEIGIDQEVLLLGPAAGVQRLDLSLAHQRQDPLGRAVHGGVRSQQRDLLVERLAGPRHEHARDHQRRSVGGVHHVGGARRVPRRVPAGLRGHPEAAVGERRPVGLALDQQAPGELGDGVPVGVGDDEPVVLLRGDVRQRVEDVREELHAFAERPVLHRRGHDVGGGRIEWSAGLDRLLHRLEGALRQTLLHGREAEHVACPDLAERAGLGRRRDRPIGDLLDRQLAILVAAHLWLVPARSDGFRGEERFGCRVPVPCMGERNDPLCRADGVATAFFGRSRNGDAAVTHQVAWPANWAA